MKRFDGQSGGRLKQGFTVCNGHPKIIKVTHFSTNLSFCIGAPLYVTQSSMYLGTTLCNTYELIGNIVLIDLADVVVDGLLHRQSSFFLTICLLQDHKRTQELRSELWRLQDSFVLG